MDERKVFYKYEHESEISDKFVLCEKRLYNKGTNCFSTKEEAMEHFIIAKKLADKKFNKIIDGVNHLKDSIGDFSIEGCAYASDDTGLDYWANIEFDINNYHFTFKI